MIQQPIATRLREVFSPGAPVDSYDLFAGRTAQVREILRAIDSRGQHVALFGERGVGKTSLANVLSELLGLGTRVLVKTTSSKGDTFNDIWRRIGREIRFKTEKPGIGFSGEAVARIVSLEAKLGEAVSPDDIRYHLASLPIPLIAIVDEFDRISGGDATRLMADCIKTFSDHSLPVTIILVGVADDIDGLVAEHGSIERALVQVRMPRMSKSELSEIVDKGCNATGMAFSAKARELCVSLAQGLPHYTHLLALFASELAVGEETMTVTKRHVDSSIQTALDRAQQSVRSLYHSATSSPRTDNLFKQVLTACALADADQLGYFAPADVRDPMSRIMGKPYEIPAFARHLKEFCGAKRGPILQRTGHERRYRYRFVNPLMQPFVLMNAMALGIVDSDRRAAS